MDAQTALRVLAVEALARPHEDRVRTAAQRLGAAHGGVDSELPRDIVRGRDNAAAAGISAHDQRLGAEARLLQLLDRGEECVQVEVRENHHTLVSHPCAGAR